MAEEVEAKCPIVDVPVPRKVSRRVRKPNETSVPRKLRKRDESGVARLPEPSRQPLLIWVPKEMDRSRGLFQQAVTDNNNVIETFQRHVEMIKLEGGIRSHFTIDLHWKARRQYHTLRSVSVNKKEFLMSEVNLSVVFSVYDRKPKTIAFGTRKEAVSFGNTFLLFMVYPGRWFQKLFGKPSDLMKETTFLIKRKRHVDFYLTKTGENGWKITPTTSNKTYEYT
jgi:hypothetical protein